MKLFIGTQFRGHDSAVCILNPETKDIFCMSTERLTRFKHDSVYPIQVIKKYIDERGLDSNKIKDVLVGNSFEWHKDRVVPSKWFEWEMIQRRFFKSKYIKEHMQKKKDFNKLSFIKKMLLFLNSSQFFEFAKVYIQRLITPKRLLRFETERLIKQQFKNANIQLEYYNHHLCHAISSYYSSSFDEALCITVDGYGDGAFSKVFKAKNGGFEEISKSSHQVVDLSGSEKIHREDGSIGGVYALFTGLLGFRPLSDEGKVEALAAYGNHNNKVFDNLMKLFSLTEKGEIKINFDFFKRYLNIDHITTEISKMKREDVAAAVQKWLEEFMLEYVKFHVRKTGVKNICLSGGVAANVIMNLRIFEEITPNIFIVPAMTDEGSAQGAALKLMMQQDTDINWIRDKSVPYWGTQYSKSDILKTVSKYSNIEILDLKDNWESEVSQRIVAGEIGAIFHGRMEWGPRALGNRSILADPRNKTSIDKINNQIKRREPFQPFCPSILEEEASRLFDKWYLNKHMTCAFRMKEEFHKELPGAIHVDGTARVQFVNEIDNPSYHKIIKKVKELNGYGVILNTSFNMHGRAMVQSPDDAIRDFLDTGMDYLVLEGILIKSK